MKRVMVGIAAAVAMTAALPATASADEAAPCVRPPVGPVSLACVAVHPDGPYVQSLVHYNGNKYLLKVDPRTGEVSLCRYTAMGSNCYL